MLAVTCMVMVTRMIVGMIPMFVAMSVLSKRHLNELSRPMAECPKNATQQEQQNPGFPHHTTHRIALIIRNDFVSSVMFVTGVRVAFMMFVPVVVVRVAIVMFVTFLKRHTTRDEAKPA